MELELGLKITRTRDDITSLSDLRISKDRNGPLFVSREIDTMFVLIAHLKDYRGDNIDIKISEDGSRIVITGAKPVEEMVLKRWMKWKKKLELRTFKKTFRVPDGVVLDQIKAKFKEEDSILTITMPKLVKGIVGGVAIEEVKEEEVDRAEPETSSNIVPEPEPEPEPETTSVQGSKEAEQVVEIKPEIVQTTAGEAPEEESDMGGTAATATEDGIIQEETNEIGEVSVDKGESDATENVPQEMPERLGQMVVETSQETQEIEYQMEVKESAPEKVEEPSVSIALEPKEVQPERETQEPETTMPPPVEEPQAEEIPEFKEERPETETKAGSELSATEVEEHTMKEKSQIESTVVEELEKQEDGVGVEEPVKPEPDQEEQAENKEQVPEQETDQARNEIQESVDEEARLNEEEERNESVNPEVEKQIDSSEGTIQENKNKKKKRPKLCPPLVVAGSAFLVTLIVLVISFIRSKKR